MTSSRIPLLLLVAALVIILPVQSFQPCQTARGVLVPPPTSRRTVWTNHRPAGTPALLVSSLQSTIEDDEEYPKFSSDVVSSRQSSTSSSSSNSSAKTANNNNTNSTTLLQRLNDFGQSFKDRAQTADTQSRESVTTRSQLVLKVKASLCWMLYLGFRGYRGFFVILPAVFRETYTKLEGVVNYRVLDDDCNPAADDDCALDVNPATGTVRLRTKLTVGVLAALITMTYVMGGLGRVLLQFGKTLVKTTSLSDSFWVAATEVEDNEGRLMKLTTKTTTAKTVSIESNTSSSSSSSSSSSDTVPVNGTVEANITEVSQEEQTGPTETEETELSSDKKEDPKKGDDKKKGGGNLWSRSRKDLGF